MSYDFKFTLDSLKNSSFPKSIYDKIYTALYKRSDVNFSIGDVVLVCGIPDAIKCIQYIPENYLHKVLRVIVIPNIERFTNNLKNSKINECLELIYTFSCKNKMSKSDLESKIKILLESKDIDKTDGSQSAINKCIDLICIISKIITDEPSSPFVNIVQVLIDMLDLVTSDSIKIDLLKVFPPVFKKYDTSNNVFYEKSIIQYKPNWLLRLLKFKKFDGRDIRFKWGSISKRWGLKLELVEFSNDGCDRGDRPTWFLTFLFIYGHFWINLPKWLPRRQFSHNGQETIHNYGFSTDEDNNTLHLSWGARRKYIDLPWCPTHVRTKTLMNDGTWESEPHWNQGQTVQDSFESRIAKEIHSYKYVLRSGTVQHRLATIKVVERERRWKWLKKFPITRHIIRSIDVEFSDEVGERSGSWKGGIIGCGYTMKLNELPSETLKRMERDRKF